MKIATWNVNSITVRLPQVLSWLQTHDIDVLALQETKIVDEKFPQQAFEDLGYQICFSGQKTYNGVATISKLPLQDPIKAIPEFEDPERRFLATTIDGVRIVNLYVPNGQSVDSEKYQYKLAWLDAVGTYLAAELKRYPNLVVLGDFNIAPEDKDVHEPMLWEGQVLVSAPERERFHLLLSLGLHDALRAIQPDEILYTWWDYRQNAFKRRMGLRIDHILLSNALLPSCRTVAVDLLPRQHERPSDHAPVWLEI